jgi:hypothetical protein
LYECRTFITAQGRHGLLHQGLDVDTILQQQEEQHTWWVSFLLLHVQACPAGNQQGRTSLPSRKDTTPCTAASSFALFMVVVEQLQQQLLLLWLLLQLLGVASLVRLVCNPAQMLPYSINLYNAARLTGLWPNCGCRGWDPCLCL